VGAAVLAGAIEELAPRPREKPLAAAGVEEIGGLVPKRLGAGAEVLAVVVEELTPRPVKEPPAGVVDGLGLKRLGIAEGV